MSTISSSWWWLWYLKLILSGLTSFFVGHALVMGLRNVCKQCKSEKAWKLSLSLFLTPISVYLFLNFAWTMGLCDRVIADAFSFGIVLGILVNLISAPRGKAIVKLVVYQADRKSEDVWLDSDDITVGEARTKIAEVLHITPASRVAIESGRGSFLEDYSAELFPLLDSSAISVDFFGFTNAYCYIYVKEEEKALSMREVDRPAKQNTSAFRSLLGNLKGETKFGDSLSLLCKAISATVEDPAFYLSPVDKFVAAAPVHLQQSGVGHVKFRLWNVAKAEYNISEIVSEAGDVSTPTSSTSKHHTASFGRKSFPVTDFTASLRINGPAAPQQPPIRNGDMVVVECDGKFMAVTKGWWMAWTSTSPRRSGAFKIELIERAPQNKIEGALKDIKEQFDALGEKISQQASKTMSTTMNTINTMNPMASSSSAGGATGGAGQISPRSVNTTSNSMNASFASGSPHGDAAAAINGDSDILHVGDTFRLRSVKFPDYEMGVTSVKLRDEFSYIGLRKINGQPSSTGEEWCLPVKFTVKQSSLLKNFKM